LADKKISVQDKLATVFDFDKVFGLDLKKMSAIERVKIQTDITLTGKTTVKIFEKIDLKKFEDEIILKYLREREQARTDKRWGEADRLREELLRFGYYIKDEKDGVSLFKMLNAK
jgi:cysteinyl-tRNA synthetase